MVEGKVQQNGLNVQFSVLWTDEQGRRVFKVVTHRKKVSDDCSEVLNSINYSAMNHSYLQAVLHNVGIDLHRWT